MNKELSEDARTKQDLLYECSNLNSRLSDEIIKNEHLEQQCKKQKEAIDDYEEDISNLLNIINKNCYELKCTSDEWLVIQKYQDNDLLENIKR